MEKTGYGIYCAGRVRGLLVDSRYLLSGYTSNYMRTLPLLCLTIILSVTFACSGSNKQIVTIYSTHGKEVLTEYKRLFEQAHPGVEMQYVDMGSQEALDRIRSERANPQADVWWGAPTTMFSQAAGEGLLQAYKPSWHDKVDKEACDANDLWYGTYKTPEVIVFNREAIKREEAPQDWDDVLDPKWKGKIIIRDPFASGTMRTIFAAMIYRWYKDSGSPEQGYDWLRKLDANTKEYVLNPTLLSQKLARQEGLITLWNMPDIETFRAQYNYPFDYVLPRSGTPVLIEGIAIVKGTKNSRLAEQFYEFVNSEESLILAATKFYRIPVRKDLAKDRLPEWIRNAESTIEVMPVDWSVLEEKTGEWMKYWNSNIRNQGAK